MNDPQSVNPVKGTFIESPPSKWGAALVGLVQSVGISTVVSAVGAALMKLLDTGRPSFWGNMRDIWSSGLYVGIAAVNVAYLGTTYYFREKRIQQLAHKNDALLSKLDQVDVVLSQMAEQVEKSSAKKPGFADREKSPVAIHADAAIADKQAAADASPTIH